MKKIIVSILISIFFNLSVFAQMETHNQTSTTPPIDGKFEIITSPLTMKSTFLLNKYTGETWELQSSDDGSYVWTKIYKYNNEGDEIPENYKGAVYQIMLSGIAARGTYLINTLTGATWVLYRDSETNVRFWDCVVLIK